jgi:hypothetical protein
VRWINEEILHMPIYCVTGFQSLRMLITDNGGGMTPDRMRACMSLGYSAKSKMANTIGQCKPFNQIISSYWNSGICHLIKLLFYIIQMEMASKLVQWGLGQMWLCFLAVGGRMETGFFITIHFDHWHACLMCRYNNSGLLMSIFTSNRNKIFHSVYWSWAIQRPIMQFSFFVV